MLRWVVITALFVAPFAAGAVYYRIHRDEPWPADPWRSAGQFMFAAALPMWGVAVALIVDALGY